MIFEEMLKEERAAGFAKGRAEGVAEGRISESKDTLLLFLQNLGTVPKVLSDQIEEQGDLDVLKKWIGLAFKSKSVEEFAKKINKNLHRRISDLISSAVAVLAGADDKKEQVNAVSGRYSKKSRGILYFVV